MTTLLAIAVNLAVAGLLLAVTWQILDTIPLEGADRYRFRAVFVLIVMVTVINMVYGFNQSGWWPIWQRFE